MSQRQRAKTQGSSLMVAWQDIPWKKVQRHVFRLQKRIYRATQRGRCQNRTQASEPAGEVMVCSTVSGASYHPRQPGETHRGDRWGEVPHTAPTMAAGQRAPPRWQRHPAQTHLDTQTWVNDGKAPAGHSHPTGPGTANVSAPSLGTRMGSQTVAAHLWLSPRTVLPGCHRSHLHRDPVSTAICAQTGYREMLRSDRSSGALGQNAGATRDPSTTAKPGSKRGFWKMATSLPPPQGRPRAAAVHRSWR